MSLKMASREGIKWTSVKIPGAQIGPGNSRKKKSWREFDRIRMVRVREFFPSSYFWYVPSADGRRAKLSVSH